MGGACSSATLPALTHLCIHSVHASQPSCLLPCLLKVQARTANLHVAVLKSLAQLTGPPKKLVLTTCNNVAGQPTRWLRRRARVSGDEL
eukprot:356905-Chlamydomonas_euryale.AAC.1